MLVMSRLEYLAELNRRLMAHDDYQPGMEFVFAPAGATPDEASGFYWLPAEAVEPMTSIALEAAAQCAVLAPVPVQGEASVADVGRLIGAAVEPLDEAA